MYIVNVFVMVFSNLCNILGLLKYIDLMVLYVDVDCFSTMYVYSVYGVLMKLSMVVLLLIFCCKIFNEFVMNLILFKLILCNIFKFFAFRIVFFNIGFL